MAQWVKAVACNVCILYGRQFQSWLFHFFFFLIQIIIILKIYLFI